MVNRWAFALILLLAILALTRLPASATPIVLTFLEEHDAADPRSLVFITDDTGNGFCKLSHYHLLGGFVVTRSGATRFVTCCPSFFGNCFAFPGCVFTPTKSVVGGKTFFTERFAFCGCLPASPTKADVFAFTFCCPVCFCGTRCEYECTPFNATATGDGAIKVAHLCAGAHPCAKFLVGTFSVSSKTSTDALFDFSNPDPFAGSIRVDITAPEIDVHGSTLPIVMGLSVLALATDRRVRKTEV